MTYSGDEIPALWVLVPFLIVSVVAMVRRLRRRGAATPARVATGLLTCAYAAAVLDTVLLPYPVGPKHPDTDVPWHVWVNLVPFASDDLYGMWLNLLLFVPLGFLLPLLSAGISAPRVAVAGFLVSLSVEVVQLVGDLTVSNGRVFDVDDLLPNTLGTVVGYAIFRGVTLIPVVRRLLAACTWPARPRVGR